MSLYREASGRGKTVVGAVVLGAAVAMLALGFFVGRATAPEPTLETRIADLREQARPVTDALELVAIHYGASNATTREAAGGSARPRRRLVRGHRGRAHADRPGRS